MWHNKYNMREALHKYGLGNTPFKLIKVKEYLLSFIKDGQLLIIVNPIGGTASINIYRVNDEKDLPRVLQLIENSSIIGKTELIA